MCVCVCVLGGMGVCRGVWELWLSGMHLDIRQQCNRQGDGRWGGH